LELSWSREMRLSITLIFLLSLPLWGKYSIQHYRNGSNLVHSISGKTHSLTLSNRLFIQKSAVKSSSSLSLTSSADRVLGREVAENSSEEREAVKVETSSQSLKSGETIISGNGESGGDEVSSSPEERELCLSEAENWLFFGNISGQNSSQNFVESDLNLSTTFLCSSGENIAIGWSSSHPDTVSSSGEVFLDRSSDTVVELTATLSAGDSTSQKSFLLNIPIYETTDRFSVEDAVRNITFDSIREENLLKSEIYGNLKLLTYGKHGTDLSWSSSDYSLSEDGEVVRFEEDREVNLTVTASKNGEMEEKSFSLTVKGQKFYDSEILKDDLQWLSLLRILGGNSSPYSVSKDLNLPKDGASGSSIYWTTSDSFTLSPLGSVNFDSEKYVELSANLEIGSISEEKSFILKVVEEIDSLESLEFKGIKDIYETDWSRTVFISVIDKLGYETITTVDIDKNISSTVEGTLFEDRLNLVFDWGSSLTILTVNRDSTVNGKVYRDGEISSFSIETVGSYMAIRESGDLEIRSGDITAIVENSGSLQYSIGDLSVISKGGYMEISENGAEIFKSSSTKSSGGETLLLEASVVSDGDSVNTLFKTINLQKDTLSETSLFPDNFSGEIEIEESENGTIEMVIFSDKNRELQF
jgi:hypothetical protein